MVAVAYRRWSFTRGSNCKALTGKILVFWIGGRLWEVVAHGGSTVYGYDVISTQTENFSLTQSSAMHINCFQRNSVIKNSLIGQSDFIRAKFCALT